MSKKTWVQHISGEGEKYELVAHGGSSDCDEQYQWLVRCDENDKLLYYLPKSDYRLCDPPAEWEDITKECYPSMYVDMGVPFCCIAHEYGYLYIGKGYRIRKVNEAFIVERKKS